MGAAPYGFAAPTFSTPTAPAALPVPPPRKRRVGWLVGGISVVLIAALLLTGGLVLYNALAHSDTAAARFVPANTVLYASVDVVAMAVNHHGVNPNALSGSSEQGKQFQQATCLDYQTDVMPWLARNIAFAVFPRPAPASGGSDMVTPNPARNLGYAVLFQSHDDSASQAAVRKAVACQQQKGSSVAQSTYGGLVLYSIAPSGASEATSALVAGDGWAVIASDLAAAQTIVDRLAGKADTLAGSTAFANATRDLPSNRFGTVFVNMRQLVASVAGAAGAAADMPLADVYPTAAGYLAWTTPGARAQVTLRAARALGLSNLTGDTTGLARLVPKDALAYAGVGNLSASVQAEAMLVSPQSPSAELFQTLFGVPSSTPGLQQPAAVALVRGASGSAPAGVFLLRAPDPSAATALLQTAARSAGWTLKPTTVDGQPATAIYTSMAAPFDGPPGVVGMPGAPGGPPPQFPAIPAQQLTAIATQVGGALVIASSPDALTSVIQTAQNASSLAENATFKQLLAQAPGGAASTTYLDVAGFQGFAGAATTPAAGSGPQTTALLVTTVWTDQLAQVTVDTQFDR